MANNARAVVFDMDGLLIDSERIFQLSWQQEARRLGFRLSDEDYFSLLGLSDEDGEAGVQRLLGDGFPLDRFRAGWPKTWWAHVEENGLPAKRGAQALLEVLSAREAPIALATSSFAERAELCLATAGLGGFFSTIVTIEEVSRGKPAPDIFLAAARQLGLAPENCLLLEDSEAGIRGGISAGMAVVAVPDLRPISPEVEREILGSFEDLVAARPTILEWLSEGL